MVVSLPIYYPLFFFFFSLYRVIGESNKLLIKGGMFFGLHFQMFRSYSSRFAISYAPRSLSCLLGGRIGILKRRISDARCHPIRREVSLCRGGKGKGVETYQTGALWGGEIDEGSRRLKLDVNYVEGVRYLGKQWFFLNLKAVVICPTAGRSLQKLMKSPAVIKFCRISTLPLNFFKVF